MDFLKNAKRLPVIDWNLTFFGAHEQTVADDWFVPLEKHYAFECIYVISGTERISLQNNDYLMEKGDFCLIPPEFVHYAAADHDLTYFCFHFDIDDPQLKGQLIQGMTYFHKCHSALGKQLAPHLNRLDRLVDNANFNFSTKMVIQIELSKILELLYLSTRKTHSEHSSTSIEYARMIADYLKNTLTDQVVNYIKDGESPQPNPNLVEQAIAKVGISSGYGFRVFKQTYGVSPREYLSRLKINETKKLLIKPQYSISNISVALGYTNLGNFSRQFRRWNEMSPKQWRQLQLSKKESDVR